MKEFRKTIKAVVALMVLLAAGFLTGCATNDPVFQDSPNLGGAFRPPTEVFHVGDLVVLSFSSPVAERQFNQHEERVKDDGYITPPDIGRVKVLGRTSGEVQKEIQEKYDKLYRNLTVTVKPGERFYYVSGEVKQEGARPYLGQTDLVSAIAAAGGFTEFAKKTKIQLIHPNGKKEIINYEKAIDDPALNRPVYPNDKIIVPRRLF